MAPRSSLKQTLWNQIRKIEGEFTFKDLKGGNLDATRDYLRELWQAEYLSRSTKKRGGLHYYRLVRDTGPFAPTPSKNIDENIQPSNDPRTRVWKAARILKVFTIKCLQETADISYSSVCSYLAILRQAGYLHQESEGYGATFRLVRDTGPLPPVAKRDRSVFDQNLEEVFESCETA